MLKIRVIPCLDVKDGRVVKGVQFVSLRDAGDPVEQARAYDAAGAAYKQAVLQGLQEVPDALHAVNNDAQTLQARALATDQAQQTLRAAQARHAACGSSGHFDLPRHFVGSFLTRCERAGFDR